MQQGQPRSISKRAILRVPRDRFIAAAMLMALGLVVALPVHAASDLVLIPELELQRRRA